LETKDYIHTYQYGESESPLLGRPLIDQVVDTNRSMGCLLPGLVYSDDDAFLVGCNDHITCMDTSVWDSGAEDISRVSAQEDTIERIGYKVFHIETSIYDDVQWPIGSHEVTLQPDSVYESQHLAGKLRVKEGMIVTTIRHIEDTHALVSEYWLRVMMSHDSLDGEISFDEFQTLRERVTVMRTEYQQLLMDIYYLLDIGEMYHRALKEKETEVDQLTHEFVST
jgi:hypothetical protein